MNNMVRHEVWLNAQDLVDIGLVKEEDILKLTPELEASLKKASASFEAYREPVAEKKSPETVNQNQNQNQITMEAQEKEALIKAEQNRVAAWMVWAEVDLAKVKAGIDSGKEISAKETQEFVLAMNNKTALKTLEANSAGKVETPAKELTAEEKSEDEYKQAEKDLNASLGIKSED